MGTVKRFEELHVYADAMDLAVEVHKICKDEAFSREYALVNQVKRAALSIASNIAEGYERGARKEFIQFCHIAKGSCGELRSHLTYANRVGILSAACFQRLCEKCLKESRLLHNFIDYLKKTEKTTQGDKFKKPKTEIVSEEFMLYGSKGSGNQVRPFLKTKRK